MHRYLLVSLSIVGCLALPSSAEASGILGDLDKPRQEGETPHFLPTLSAAIGFDGTDKGESYGNFLLGASHYPFSQPWSPFYSVAAELDVRTIFRADRAKTAAVFGPQIRAGISFFPDNNGYISVFNAYAFGGYRLPSPVDGGAFRFGMGVSSPGFGLGLLVSGLPLPWMFEWAVDVTDKDLRFGGRVGISY